MNCWMSFCCLQFNHGALTHVYTQFIIKDKGLVVVVIQMFLMSDLEVILDV